MGRFVIAAYKSKPGREEALLAVVRKHRHVLRAENKRVPAKSTLFAV